MQSLVACSRSCNSGSISGSGSVLCLIFGTCFSMAVVIAVVTDARALSISCEGLFWRLIKLNDSRSLV